MIRICDFKEDYRVLEDKTTEFELVFGIKRSSGTIIDVDIWNKLVVLAYNKVCEEYKQSSVVEFYEYTLHRYSFPRVIVKTKASLKEGDDFDEKLGRSIARAKAKRIAYTIQRKMCKYIFSMLYNISSECVYSGVMAEREIDGEELYLDKFKE